MFESFRWLQWTLNKDGNTLTQNSYFYVIHVAFKLVALNWRDQTLRTLSMEPPNCASILQWWKNLNDLLTATCFCISQGGDQLHHFTKFQATRWCIANISCWVAHCRHMLANCNNGIWSSIVFASFGSWCAKPSPIRKARPGGSGLPEVPHLLFERVERDRSRGKAGCQIGIGLLFSGNDGCQIGGRRAQISSNISGWRWAWQTLTAGSFQVWPPHFTCGPRCRFSVSVCLLLMDFLSLLFFIFEILSGLATVSHYSTDTDGHRIRVRLVLDNGILSFLFFIFEILPGHCASWITPWHTGSYEPCVPWICPGPRGLNSGK